MQHNLLHQADQSRTSALVSATGEKALDGLQKLASDQHIWTVQITGIGAVRDVMPVYFDWDGKKYLATGRGQIEGVSLIAENGLAFIRSKPPP
jgi:predicted DNA-binding protein with PD1-like motif